MNNKAFTLIELVAIIIILALIFIVTFPNISNLLRNNKEEEYESMVESLCLAGKSYIYSNTDDFADLTTPGKKIELNIRKLILYKTVDEDLVNPKNNKSIINDILVFTVKSDQTLDCEYIEK